MAAELTIQSVEGLSKAFDKLSRSVGGVKSALGTMKGTNALQELQAVVAGVDRLQAALVQLDKGTGVALAKIVAKLDALPTAMADALGSGAASIRASGKKLAQASEDAVKEAAAKAEKASDEARDKAAAKQARADGQFRAALESRNTKMLESQQAADATFRAAQEAAAAKLLAQQIAANEKQNAVDAAFREAQRAAESRHAAEMAALREKGQAAVNNILKAANAEREAIAKAEAAARERQLQADRVFDAAQAAAQAKKIADTTAANEKQMAVDAVFREAQRAAEAKDAATAAALRERGQRAVNNILKAAQSEREALAKAEQASRERQLQVDRVFNKAQEDAAAKAAAAMAARAKEAADAAAKVQAQIAKAQVNQSLSSGNLGLGSYSVFAPSSAEHGRLKQFNAEMGTTASRARAAGDSFKGLRIDADDAHSAMRGLASGFNLLWLTWGNLLPLLAGAALSNGFTQTVKMGLEVNKTFETIRVLSEETTGSIMKLQGQMLELSKTGFSLREISESMKTLSLAGLSAGEVGSSIRDVLNFAIAGDTTLKASADTLTSVAKAFSYSADQFNIVSDIISKTAAVSKSSVENMSEAFKVASVINSQYGASLEDVGTGLAALSNLGITGSAAGTALRNMYADLSGRSKEVVKILKEMKVQFRDVDTGKFPDLITMMQRFEEALNKTGSAIERQDLMNKLLSERGAKPVIEMLELMRKKAIETNTTVANQLEELRNKIANSAGFSAIAAAELSTTASRQIDATFSALQVSAYKAFADIEPAIFRVTAALRNAFESKSFQDALASIMSGVASAIEGLARFTSVVAENADAMKNLLLIWAGAKVVGMVGGSLLSAATSMSAFSEAAAKAGGVTALLTTTLKGTTSAAAPAATGLAGVAASAGGLFTVLGRGLALLGPIAAALTVAYTAWQLYSDYANKAAEANEKHTGRKSDELVAALENEVSALREKKAALIENISLEEYQRRQKGNDALAEQDAEIAKATKARAEALAAFNKAKKDYGGYGQGLNEAYSAIINKREAEFKLADDVLRLAEQQREASKQRVDDLKKEVLQLSAYIKTLSDYDRAKAASNKADETAGKLTGEYDPEAAARAAAEAANKELQNLERRYAIERDMVKSASESRLRLLEDEHSKKLISEGEYQIRHSRMVEAAEAEQLAIAVRYQELEAKAVAAQRNRIAAKYKDSVKLPTQLDNFDQSVASNGFSMVKDITAIQGNALERQAKAANSAAAAINDLKRSTDDYWAKDAARLNELSSAKKQAEDLENATEAQRNYATAFEAAYKAYIPRIEEQSRLLAQVQAEYEVIQGMALQDALFGAVDDKTIQSLGNAAERIRILSDDISRLRAAASSAGGAAGNDSIISKFVNSKELEDSARGFDKAGKAMAGFVSSLEKLMKVQTEAAAASAASQQKMVDALGSGDAEKIAQARIEFEKERAAIQDKTFRSEIRGYGNVAGAAKAFFKEGSTGYKTLSAAEKAFRAVEFAMAVKSVAMKVWEWATKATVVATGEGTVTATTGAAEAARNLLKIPGVFLEYMSQLGPWGVPAAAAAIAALGVAAGARSPKGSFGTPNEGTGTVFGDSSAKSKSISNAIEKLAGNSDITLTYSQGMLASLKNIEANISGLTNIVLRANVNGSTADRLGVSNSTTVPLGRSLLGGGLLGGVMNVIGNYVPIIGKINSFLFGTKTTVKGTGLTMANTNLAQLIAGGGNLQEYADVNTTKSFLGIKYSNKNSTTTGAADPAIAKQFQLIFQDVYKSIQLAATPLGQNLNEITSKLDNFVVSIGKIDLQGLTGEQIQEKLTAVLGAAADSIATAALPGFEQFQKVGEGYFETIVRVANGSEQAKNALDRLGLKMVSYNEILNKQGDVATELVRQSIMKAEVLRTETISKIPTEPPRAKALRLNFPQSAEEALDFVRDFGKALVDVVTPATVVVPILTGVGKIIENFTGSAEELVQLYESLVQIREGLKAIGKGSTDFGIEMIKAAGGVDALKGGLQSFYDNFLTDQERIAAMTGNLSKKFADIGVAMPTTIEGFAALVKGLDTNTIAGQETFGKLIVLSDAFKKLQDAMAEANTAVNAVAEERKNLEEQLAKAQQAYNEATMTSAQLLALQRSKIDASNLALFDQIQALNAATEAAKKAASERASLQSQLDDLTLSEAQKLAAQRAALEPINQALFDQVQAAKAAKAAEDALAASRKAQADEIASLRDQLDELVLTDAQKAAKQRNALLSDEAKGLFDQVQAIKAAQAAEQELADARKAQADEIANLRNQIDDLTLTDAQKAAKQRDALLSAEAKALFDQVQAIKAAQAAEQELAATRKAQADEIANLRNQLDDVTLTDAEKLLRQRNALLSDEAKTLFDQVQAAKAAQAAEQALAASRKAQADEVANIRSQLDDLTLTDSEKLLRQRNALLSDEAKALFDQVQAVKAAQAAEQELAASRKAQADEITNLRDQLDDLVLTDAQKLAKQRKALLSDEARGIFDQIQAAKAAQAAQESAQKAAEDAAKAAEELRKAWEDAANGIKEEIDRIRGVTGTPAQTLAQAQGAFSIAVAQAQSGSVDAAKNLPKLSQDLLKIAGDSAKSSLEFATIQSSTLGALDRTLNIIGGGSAPRYSAPEMATTGAYGSGYTPATAPQANAPTYEELLAEMRELKQLVATLLTQNQAIGSSIATSTAKTAKILENVTPEGDAVATRSAA